jgi:hypothetical protein
LFLGAPSHIQMRGRVKKKISISLAIACHGNKLYLSSAYCSLHSHCNYAGCFASNIFHNQICASTCTAATWWQDTAPNCGVHPYTQIVPQGLGKDYHSGVRIPSPSVNFHFMNAMKTSLLGHQVVSNWLGCDDTLSGHASGVSSDCRYFLSIYYSIPLPKLGCSPETPSQGQRPA